MADDLISRKALSNTLLKWRDKTNMKIITKTVVNTTWAKLKAAIQEGTETKLIHSGDLISFSLKNGEKVAVKATYDENGKLFFVLDNCLEDERSMNREDTTEGGWAACAMRKYLNKTVFALLPDELQAVIAPTHIVQIVDGERVGTDDKLFLLSCTQVFGKGLWSECEPEDTQFDCFLHERDRVKERGDGGTWYWWLRSAHTYYYFYGVHSDGFYSTTAAHASGGVALGFCLS